MVAAVSIDERGRMDFKLEVYSISMNGENKYKVIFQILDPEENKGLKISVFTDKYYKLGETFSMRIDG